MSETEENDTAAHAACAILGQGWIVSAEVHRNQRSSVTQLRDTNSGRLLAVKQYLTDNPCAHTEFELLKTLPERVNTASSNMISTPVMVVPNWNAYCLEWLEGPKAVADVTHIHRGRCPWSSAAWPMDGRVSRACLRSRSTVATQAL